MSTLYKLLDKLEELAEKWENKPYTGDYTKAAYSVAARELREILGQSDQRHWVQDSTSNDAETQKGYFDTDVR